MAAADRQVAGAGRHVDVLIIGAGLSGIGAAWRLAGQRQGRTYAVLEARGRIGGTWDLFRCPGVRSDSDMFTLSYPFRPWRGARSLADGESRYYDYSHGYQPEFDGAETFAGRFVHPQFWPPDLDVTGRRVVVIGSGATAVTLVPALTAAAHVTMLQRSPSYLAALPAVDRIADALRRFLPARIAHTVIRGKNVLLSQPSYTLSRRFPESTRRHLHRAALRYLPDAAYLRKHFSPAYEPWDQVSVDGEPVDLGATVAYRGLMVSGVPNFAFCIGYANASWTLRADLSSRYVCRLLAFMDRHGFVAAVPGPSDGPATSPAARADVVVHDPIRAPVPAAGRP